MLRMKLPRWLVIAMLTTSVLAVLVAAGWFGWWWVTWPERTAREFVQRLAMPPSDETWCQIVTEERDRERIDLWLRFVTPIDLGNQLEPKHRSFEDLFVGRGRFAVSAEVLDWEFTVDRGCVHDLLSSSIELNSHLPRPVGKHRHPSTP